MTKPAKKPIIYLDQNVIIDLEKGYLKQFEQILLQSRENGDVLIPFSSTHIYETNNITGENRKHFIQDRLLKEVKNKYQSVGVLGIACIPELARGMRLSIHLEIPPIGIPLDANRCSRWMGKAYENSFNLKELENLVK